jgi:hypothetical protein
MVLKLKSTYIKSTVSYIIKKIIKKKGYSTDVSIENFEVSTDGDCKTYVVKMEAELRVPREDISKFASEKFGK